MNDRSRLPDKATLLTRVMPRREKWRNGERPKYIEMTNDDEESVWDYPRPPQVRETQATIEVRCGDATIARSSRGLNIAETAGAPVHYVPPADVRTEWLVASDHVSICEWKGAAVHYDLVMPGVHVEHAAFVYPDPLDDLHRGFARIAGWFAFYPSKLACFLNGERVRPQDGGLYAGWITDNIKGPIKGAPGTGGW